MHIDAGVSVLTLDIRCNYGSWRIVKRDSVTRSELAVARDSCGEGTFHYPMVGLLGRMLDCKQEIGF